jgi:hypothetical protein
MIFGCIYTLLGIAILLIGIGIVKMHQQEMK